MSKTFYITTPIYYVNDVPHIGHAYTTIAADVLARFWRLMGRDVFFLTGLDEHGQKVQQAASKAGIDPKQYCDGMAPRFQELWKRLNISNDAFIRTTDPQHKAVVQKKLQELYDKRLIYKANYIGWYCTFDERFWTEKDVIDGLCPECKRPVGQLSESNYFFRMSQFQEPLIQHIKEHKEYFIQPQSRCNEVFGFLQKPLGDLSISRPKSRLAWGIELPFDPNYVTYVWFDALVNYISALEYLTPHPDEPERYWSINSPLYTYTMGPNPVFHLIGKDILTTHAVYWSTMLMALKHPLPTKIFAHGWWTVNGEKMSKSRGNVVDPNAIVDEFGAFGADAFRYFLLREVPFGQDGDFSKEAMVGRINGELANDLGNLLNRTLVLLERFSQGIVPPPVPAADTDDERNLRLRILGENISRIDQIELQLFRVDFARALRFIWEPVQLGNGYLEKVSPWTLAKNPDNKPKLNNTLYHCAQVLRYLSHILYPFMPSTAEEISRQLGLHLDYSTPLLQNFVWSEASFPGTRIIKGNPLFPQIDTSTAPKGSARVTDYQPIFSPLPSTTSAPSTSQPQQAEQPVAPQITIEEFQKIHLKVATVLKAERVPKSEKLLKLQVDLGGEQRQIVAGIGKKYEPETLVGRRIVIVANLKPAKLMGIESQGMVLAAGDKEVMGLVTILEEVDPGTKVK